MLYESIASRSVQLVSCEKIIVDIIGRVAKIILTNAESLARPEYIFLMSVSWFYK